MTGAALGAYRPDLQERYGQQTPGAESLRPFNRIAIDVSHTPEPLEVLLGWFYVGKLHVLQSEPGVGKSYLAAWVAWLLMELGYVVIYLDEESGADLMTERLASIGAAPDVVARRLFFYSFESRRWNEDDVMALDEVITAAQQVDNGPALAVFDSLPDHLAGASLSEDSAQDVTTWVNTVLRGLARANVAQLVLDHLPKPQGDTKKRSRYSRGSGAKLAKSEATLLLEAGKPFDTHNSGTLTLWKTKDRRGRLDVPLITASAGLGINVTVNNGTVTFELEQPKPAESWDGPTACMDAVLTEVLMPNPGQEFTGNNLITALRDLGHPYRDKTIREAAERLALAGDVTARTGRNNSRLFSWRPTDNTQETSLDEQF